jgi:hypothetical protein
MSQPKEIFVALSYSAHVDYETGLVLPDYKDKTEKLLTEIEAQGHKVFCALREDGYKINDRDKAAAYDLDVAKIDESDLLLAIIGKQLSGGVQNEIGIAQGRRKLVIIAHDYQTPVTYLNEGAIKSAHSGTHELTLPINFFEFNRLAELA